jgi:hypothetical protein
VTKTWSPPHWEEVSTGTACLYAESIPSFIEHSAYPPEGNLILIGLIRVAYFVGLREYSDHAG